MSGRARPVVLAAPSGTGKTTIAHRLVEGARDFTFSISATTRTPREGERDGVDYLFLGREAFETMARAGELVEWAEVHGRLYGTPKEALEREASEGRHVVLDIDVQGARQIRERVPDALLVFVLPPSIEALLDRLAHRGTEAPAEVARRLRTALDEFDAVEGFDGVLVNDDLDGAVARVREVTRGQGALPTPADEKERIETLRAGVARVLRDRFYGVA